MYISAAEQQLQMRRGETQVRGKWEAECEKAKESLSRKRERQRDRRREHGKVRAERDEEDEGYVCESFYLLTFHPTIKNTNMLWTGK